MIADTDARSQWTAAGGTDFVGAFEILAEADALVLANDVEQTLNIHYTIAGVGNSSFTVTFLTAPASGVTITILYRDTVQQNSDYARNEAFPAERIERDLDILKKEILMLREQMRRAAKMPRTVNLVDVPFPTPVGNGAEYLRVNAGGTGYESVPLAPATDLAAFLASGTGAVSRTATAKMADIVSVKDFGAVGDDSTDNTTLIQNAINAIATITTYGGALFIPRGIYRVTQLSIPSGLTVYGDGPDASILKKTAAGGSNFSGIITNTDKTGPCRDITIRDLGFHRTVEVDTAFDEHIYFEQVTNAKVINCRFTGTISTATHTQKGVHFRGCQYGVVEGNVFVDLPDNALAFSFLTTIVNGYHLAVGNKFIRTSSHTSSQLISTQSDVAVIGNSFSGASASRVGNWIETGQGNSASIFNLTLTGNVVRRFNSVIHDVDGLVASGNTFENAGLVTDVVSAGSTNVIYSGNHCSGGGQLKIKTATNVLVEGNWVNGASASDGILVQNCTRATVRDNVCHTNGKSGINVDATVGGPLSVTNNICYNNGVDGSSDAWFGILIATATDPQIEGNYCHDTQGGSATQRHGIALIAGTRVVLVNNISRDNLTGAYREISAVTSFARRAGNVFNGLVDIEVNTPSATQALTVAGNTILANSRIVKVSLPSAGSTLTLTSAPTIANGYDGQIVTIICLQGTLTIQDQGTLASSNLRLVGTNMAIGPRDNITLMYDSSVGDWVELSRSNVT